MQALNAVRIFWLLILCLTISIMLSFFIQTASAADFSVGINPPIMRFTATPPATINEPFTVSNATDSPVTLSIVGKAFTSVTEDGNIQYVNDIAGANPAFMEHVWVKDGTEIVQIVTLPAKGEKKLFLNIDIPANEPASDYYFSIIFISKNVGSQQEDFTGSTTIIGGVAMNILMTVSGDSLGNKEPELKPEGIVQEFSSPTFAQKGPIPFTVRVKNIGNTLLTPTGSIKITNMFGQFIGKVDLLPTNILAGTTRAIPDSFQSQEATAPATPASSNQRLASSSIKSYWYETVLLGPYQAQLTLSLSENGPTYTRTIRFFAFPAEASVGLLLGILAIGIVVTRVRKRIQD